MKNSNYIEPEKVNEDILDAIYKVQKYCRTHEEYEDCKHCVLGDGIHSSSCSSPWLWNVRK